MKMLKRLTLLALIMAMPATGASAARMASPRWRRIQRTQPVQTAQPVDSSNPANAEEELVAQVNAERAKYGLGALRVDSELTRAAQVRAREIVQKFSHTRPDGTAWNTVSASAYGENIAVGQRSVDKVMAAWLTSKGHRENILRASYGSIGVCRYVSGGVTYWVQLFGK